MLNICIVIPQFFPVPAVKGGAVEQLATFLADENEKNQKLNMTIVSIYDEEAVCASKQYKNTKFEYIPITEKKEEFDYSGVNDIFYEYMDKVSKFLEKNEFDYVIMMGGKKEHVIPCVPYEKRITYLHGVEIEKNLEKYYKRIVVVSHYIANCYYTQTDTPNEYVIPLENAIHIEDFCKKNKY